jgi:hypothetical protein
VFGAATVAIAIVVVTAFVLFVRSSHASILQASERQQDRVARRVEARVVRELGRAQRVLEDVERGIRAGAIDVDQPLPFEASFFTRVLDEPHLEEVTFTRASLLGYDANGDAQLAPAGRWQLSVRRTHGARRRDAQHAA